jgi:hypothetical protein
VAERFADGLTTRKELKAAWLACGGERPPPGHNPAHMTAQVSLKPASSSSARTADHTARSTNRH